MLQDAENLLALSGTFACPAMRSYFSDRRRQGDSYRPKDLAANAEASGADGELLVVVLDSHFLQCLQVLFDIRQWGNGDRFIFDFLAAMRQDSFYSAAQGRRSDYRL